MNGQNGLIDGDYFLLINDMKTISVNTHLNNETKEIKTFSYNGMPICATDQKNRVAILDKTENNISLYDIHSSKEIILPIPYDIKFLAILLNNENIFVGGEKGEAMLAQYHIPSNKWFKLEVPEELGFLRKGVDDIVINDNFLIAIDNVVMPKYILLYRLNTTDRLAFSSFKELKSNGTYESIYKGKISSKYFGLASLTNHGYIGSSRHITIYDYLNISRSFTITTNSREKDYHTFNDFLIVGDRVVVASMEKGLGTFKIKRSYFRNSDKSRSKIIKASKINYKRYKNENIIRMTMIPNTEKFVLILLSLNNEIRHETIELKKYNFLNPITVVEGN